MGRQPSRVVLALATEGALSFETNVLFGQRGFALPPHGARSPTAKGMESKGLRARVRSRKTSPVSPVGALTGASTCGLRMMKKFGGAQSLSSRRMHVGRRCPNCAGASHSTYPWEDASTIGVSPTAVVAVRSPPLVTLHGNLTLPCQCIHAPHYLRPFQNPPLIQTERDQKPKGGTGDDATLCGRYMGACP